MAFKVKIMATQPSVSELSCDRSRPIWGL